MGPVVFDASRAALLSVAFDAVVTLAEACQLLEIDVNQIAGPLPFLALNRRLWIQVSQPAQPQAVQRSGHGGEGSCEQPGDVSQVEPLMAHFNVDRPVRPTHLSDNGPATCKHSAGKSLHLQLVLPGGDGCSAARKSIAAGPSASDGRWRMYAWGVRSRLGADTSTHSGLTPHWLLNNPLRRNI